MKQLVENVLVNEKYQDTVIEYFMKYQKDERGKIIYSKPEDNIGVCKGSVHEIIIYIKDDNDFSKVNAVKIGALSIKKLYAHILEIEKLESEEFIDL